MRNPEVPQCQIDKNSFPNSTFRSEDEFIKGLQFSYPKPLDFFNLKLFLLNQTPGSERVNFIARIVKNYPLMINGFKEFFNDLVLNGSKRIPSFSDVQQKEYSNSVNRLIEDFINIDSNFPIYEGCQSNNIFIAIRSKKINLLNAILERDPDSVNAKNINGSYPIHEALAPGGDFNIFKKILEFPNLDLYAKFTRKTINGKVLEDKTVFDISKALKNKHMDILLVEHKNRLMAKNPKAIFFEKDRASPETQSSSINPYISQASFRLSDVMEQDGLLHYQHHSVKPQSSAPEEMASPLIINPDAPQTSFQLSAESPMVWDDPDRQGEPMLSDLAEMAKMYMSVAKSENGDTSSQSAFRPFKRTKTSSVGAFISNSEAGQLMDNGERITSRISPTSQESLSGSDKGKGGSK